MRHILENWTCSEGASTSVHMPNLRTAAFLLLYRAPRLPVSRDSQLPPSPRRPRRAPTFPPARGTSSGNGSRGRGTWRSTSRLWTQQSRQREKRKDRNRGRPLVSVPRSLPCAGLGFALATECAMRGRCLHKLATKCVVLEPETPVCRGEGGGGGGGPRLSLGRLDFPSGETTLKSHLSCGVRTSGVDRKEKGHGVRGR